jgi:hypothetical protein
MNQFNIKKMRKVTIGFKADPGLKLELKEEAEESEMTVSEYLEAIVENRQVQEDVKMLRYRMRQTIQDKDNTHFKLEEYEQRVDPVYKKYKGQTLSFREKDGTISNKTINHPVDIIDCMLSSLNKQS